MTEINRETCKALAAEIEAALAPVAARHGLSVRVGGGKFDSLRFVPKVEFAVEATADGRSAAQAEFDKGCALIGLLPGDFGKTFINGGVTFRVSGLALNRPSKPILATRVDNGREYVFTRAAVRQIRGAS